MPRAPVLVAGVGRLLRGDDAAGPLAARSLRLRVPPGVEVVEVRGDPLRLLELWRGRRAAVVLDAVVSGAPVGTVHRIDASTRFALPAGSRTSTHGSGPGEAIEIARALGTLPATVLFWGIEGGRFEPGAGLSPQVTAALPLVVEEVLRAARELAAGFPIPGCIHDLAAAGRGQAPSARPGRASWACPAQC